MTTIMTNLNVINSVNCQAAKEVNVIGCVFDLSIHLWPTQLDPVTLILCYSGVHL